MTITHPKTQEAINNITAVIILDSISPDGSRITTFELEYPRFIHSEFMTHRAFSRNAASSRAIPVETVIENIKAKTALPVYWGKNKAGMMSSESLNPHEIEAAYLHWILARDNAIQSAKTLSKKDGLNMHKQIPNRLLEPFQYIKVIVTATDYANFFALRNHVAAQPEIQVLAKKMQEAMFRSKPTLLLHDMWHIPYIKSKEYYQFKSTSKSQLFFDVDDNEISLNDALIISASACAQVSYRKNDLDLEKAKRIYSSLIESKPVHASPVEHQARCIYYGYSEDSPFYDRNFRNWKQHRSFIKDNVVLG